MTYRLDNYLVQRVLAPCYALPIVHIFKKLAITSLFFFILQTIEKQSIVNILRIRTTDLWCWKRLLYQLWHNHCLCIADCYYPSGCQDFVSPVGRSIIFSPLQLAFCRNTTISRKHTKYIFTVTWVLTDFDDDDVDFAVDDVGGINVVKINIDIVVNADVDFDVAAADGVDVVNVDDVDELPSAEISHVSGSAVTPPPSK